MTDALNDHEGRVSIDGRNITNLLFAYDIDGLAGTEEELADLVDRLDKSSTAFGMQINAEKTTLMTNNTNGFSTDIRVNNEKLDCVNRFKYLGAIIADEGSKPEILARIAQATAARAKLKTIWNDRNIALSSKMRSLVMPIFLYACEYWTLTADTEKTIQAMEMRCLRKTPRHHIQRPHLPRRGPKQNRVATDTNVHFIRIYNRWHDNGSIAKREPLQNVQGFGRNSSERTVRLLSNPSLELSCVTIVFHRYNNGSSIKATERERWVSFALLPTYQIQGSRQVPNYLKFLKGVGNKASLANYISLYILEHATAYIPNGISII